MRLARAADLKACWDGGQRWRTTLLELAWRPNQTGHPRIAIVVPRFQFTAVARNRLRRRLRETLRRGPLARMPSVDLVVRSKRAAYAAPAPALRGAMLAGVSQIT